MLKYEKFAKTVLFLATFSFMDIPCLYKYELLGVQALLHPILLFMNYMIIVSSV